VASDVDHYYAAMAHPGNVQVLAHSPVPSGMGQTSLGAFYSDMTYYTDPSSGAGVLDTGTSNWIPARQNDRAGCDATAGSCATGILQRITGNILRVFGQGPAGLVQPAVANARQVTGQ
jgi:hypothetical protein